MDPSLRPVCTNVGFRGLGVEGLGFGVGSLGV